MPIAAEALRPKRWIALIRLRHWAHFLALPAAGVDLLHPSVPGALALARGIAVSFCVLAFGYLLNGVSDRAMDLDPKKNPLIAQRGDERRYDGPLVALAVVALALAALGPTVTFAAAAACLACGWLYSVGPRLKTVPLVGTLMNAGNFAPLLFVGLDGATPPARLVALLTAFVALLLQNQLLHEAADAAEDRRGGVRSTFLVLGARGAAILAAICGAVVMAVALHAAARHAHPRWTALHALPYLAVFPLLLARQGASPERMAKARVAQRWAAALSGALLFAIDLR